MMMPMFRLFPHLGASRAGCLGTTGATPLLEKPPCRNLPPKCYFKHYLHQPINTWASSTNKRLVRKFTSFAVPQRLSPHWSDLVRSKRITQPGSDHLSQKKIDSLVSGDPRRDHQTTRTALANCTALWSVLHSPKPPAYAVGLSFLLCPPDIESSFPISLILW